MDGEPYGPDNDRREQVRRAEDETLFILNAAMFGVPGHPETGLMNRHIVMERKMDELIAEAQAAKWANYVLVISVLTGTVIGLATGALG